MTIHYTPRHELTESYRAALELLSAGQTEDALARLLQEPAESTCYPYAQGNAALVLLERGRPNRAARHANAAITRFNEQGCAFPPSLVQSCRLLADAHAAQGHSASSLGLFEEACKVADGLCREEPEHEGAILQEKAHALVSWGNSLLALELWREAQSRYEEAREIYRLHPSFDQAGVPQALTNLAIAAGQQGDLGRADLALQEARFIAESQGDADQVHRILVRAVQIGSSMVPPSERHQTLVTAAEAAEKTNRLPSAIRRYAIAAQYDLTTATADHRLSLVERAKGCAGRLDCLTPDTCKLYTTEAQVREARGDRPELLLPCLLEGARLWHRLFLQDLCSYDSFAIGRDLHHHFRRLADVLMALGRTEDALLTFEAGRALAHTREIDPALVAESLRRPLFLPEGEEVDLALLRNVQDTIPAGSVVISLINIRQQFLAFAVRRDGVQAESFATPDSQADLDALVEEIRSIPYGLEKGHGLSVIPPAVVAIAKGIRDLAGSDAIIRLIPYGPLHAVPWRVLLRHVGLPWDAVAYATAFSLLPLASPVPSPDLSQGRVIGLGYDPDGHPAFCEEPRKFTQLFGARGEYREPCSENNVKYALSTAMILDLSCHGFGRNVQTDVELVLRLERPGGGGSVDVPLLQFCPERVAPALVILSACYSGAYNMAAGDYPVGGAPTLLQRGTRYCLVMRFAARAVFARDFVIEFAQRLATGADAEDALLGALKEMEASGSDCWKDLGCVELVAGR